MLVALPGGKSVLYGVNSADIVLQEICQYLVVDNLHLETPHIASTTAIHITNLAAIGCLFVWMRCQGSYCC
jgi:hypothetical protein